MELGWNNIEEQLPTHNQLVIAYIPENYEPLPGNPSEVELKPIKILKFLKDFYGEDKPRHKNTTSNHFWSGEGKSNHFFEEVSHWMSFPPAP